MVLMRSMEKREGWRYSEVQNVQKSLGYTHRTLQIFPLSGDDLALSAGLVKGQFVATLCPSEGRWYQHFESGMCA
jgi:hypothetical protein